MKKTYYKLVARSTNSVDGELERVNRVMWVEVNVNKHKVRGLCEITPVAGNGSIIVKKSNLKIV